jgi:uncharacterized protein (TIGR03067 family)
MKKTLLLIAVVFGLAADEPKKADKKDASELDGTWVVVKMERGGQENEDSKGDELTIAGNQFKVKRKNGDMKGAVKLNAKATPKAIDLILTDGPQQGTALGIYKLDKERLMVCLNQPDATDRPTEFASKVDSQYMLVTLEKQKKR